MNTLNTHESKSRPVAAAGWRRRIANLLGVESAADEPPAETCDDGAPRPRRATDRISVVIPALNEERRIADVVRHVLADPATAEVIVVDDCSIDATVERATTAGARVVRSSMLGKGASMHDGARAASHEIVAYLDGDLAGLRPGLVTDLCRPLLEDEADFVKARFGRSGGRVTELTAKPMLKVFFPELAGYAQPLGGIIAARRALLHSLAFEDGYGVDIGLLIDASRAGARLCEVDIGSLENDSQPLPDLTVMANEVSRVIFNRARAAGRLHVDQIAVMYETQRQAAASLEYIMSRRRGRRRVMLLDMDGTLTPQRFVKELARATRRDEELAQWLDQQGDAATRSQRIAEVFRFVHRNEFERVAHALTIRPGVIECIHRAKQAGFMVGVVSDSYFVAAEIVRRRVFADFALAHPMHFDADVCSGRLNINEAFRPMVPGKGAPVSKGHVVARIRASAGEPPIETVWAVGDNLNDLDMLQQADRAFVIEPQHDSLVREADATRIDDFSDLTLSVAALPPPA
ncbi:MAG: glycosyltransferase [Burkholderiaceae bacterium]|jgi:phosphoserine phosphatase|nr:glycosyltransferase [Aquabacterium sp.]NUP86594.1 glycosyltransferase [Burkholderiaceae bacterium]